jgi:helicase MOV-10
MAKHNISDRDMVRIQAFSRSPTTVGEAVLKYCKLDEARRGFNFPTKKELSRARVVVATVTTAGKLYNNGLDEPFDVVFIDEAGHAQEPEAIAPIATLLGLSNHQPGVGRIVLAGDPRQLGPIITSDIAKQHGLELSLLERLIRRPLYARCEFSGEHKHDPLLITKLEQNYRSHPAILELPNKLFYDGDLEVAADPLSSHSLCNWEHLPTKGVPLIFHGIEGNDKREGNSPSWFNADEASVVAEYVRKLVVETRMNPVQLAEIGVISPYAKQVQKLQTLLKYEYGNDAAFKQLKVASVELFQGQERRVIIISTVRSSEKYLEFDQKHRLGFLTNPKRFNVAITRAKSLLIVVGNPKVLSTDEHWGALIRHCQQNGSYTGCSFDSSTASGGDGLGAGDDSDQQAAVKLVEGMLEGEEGEDEDEEPGQRLRQEAGAIVRHDE